MNTKNMYIQRRVAGFSVSYKDAVICEADVNCDDGEIILTFVDGRRSTVDVSALVELSYAYNSQFGLTLTDDGSYIFVQSWEKGLFCFDTKTGKLFWTNKQKRAGETATHGTTILCHFRGQGIWKLDLHTGAVLKKYPLAEDKILKPLSQEHYLAGPKRGYYEILDGGLEREARVSEALLNPNGLDTFIIQDAFLIAGRLMIEGVEYRTQEFLAAVKDKLADSFLDNHHFFRQVELNMTQ